MKFNNVLALGSLLAMAGSALAVPVPEAAVRVVTVTRVKVMGITRTKYVPPATIRASTTSVETTTTITSTSSSSTEEETSTSTSTSSTSTSSVEEEEEETTTSTTPTPTPTPEPETTTTTEERKETPTPQPIPPPEEEEEEKPVEVIKDEPVKDTRPPRPPPPPKNSDDTFHGEATYFDPGMGSCGEVHGPNDMIAAISFQVMDPKNPGNPNNNPLCGKKIKCMRNGDPATETIVTVVDRCPVCVSSQLSISIIVFSLLTCNFTGCWRSRLVTCRLRQAWWYHRGGTLQH